MKFLHKHCLKVWHFRHGADRLEVERYIERIDSKEEKYDLYVDLELWMKAAETAFKLKDGYRLQEVNIFVDIEFMYSTFDNCNNLLYFAGS